MSQDEITLRFKPEHTVASFMLSNLRDRLINGPVGSGKSSGCCVEIRRRAEETPKGSDGVRRSRWAVVRNTYRELEDTTIKTFKEWVPEPYFGRWHASDHIFELCFETDNGMVRGEVLFRALDRPDDVKKLLSLELTGCYFNEMREIPRVIYTTMRTRVGRYPRRDEVPTYWSGCFGDTNPPDEDHWIYKVFEEERPEGYRIWKQPGGRTAAAENVWNLDRCWRDPHENLMSDEAKAESRAGADRKIAAGVHQRPCVCYYPVLCQGATPDFINVMVDGNYGFLKPGKPIYPEYQDAIHTAKEPIPILASARKILCGQDYGLTPAGVWVQQDPADGQYQVVDEFVSERLGAVYFGEELARIAKTEFRGKAIEGWGDPAGMAGSSVDEHLTPILVVSNAGVQTTAAPTNDPTKRREAVAKLLTRLTMLGRPALVVSPKCRTLRKAMNGAYCYERLKVSGADRFRDSPLKNEYSHVAEALQYAMVGAGEDLSIIASEDPDVDDLVIVTKLAGGGTRTSKRR
jgi:hypothetical protein